MITATQKANIVLMNNTGADIRIALPQIHEAIKSNTELPEEISDMFSLKVLVAFNPDGSNRGILNWAD